MGKNVDGEILSLNGSHTRTHYSRRLLQYPQWRINNSNQYVGMNENETADIILFLCHRVWRQWPQKYSKLNKHKSKHVYRQQVWR